jgi:nucleoid-associated protein YejK
MNLNNIIVHKLNKEAQGKASLELRENYLPIGEREIEFVTNLKQAYYRKSNPNYGVFNGNAVAYPFQSLLRNYADDNSQFYQFTENAMSHLLGIINAVPQATGGYVVFAHYILQNEEFVIIVMLNNKKQYNINDNLSIEEIFSLDIDKLDVANFVNLTRWNEENETYLSFARGRKEISKYFKNFIGCTDQTSAKQSSQQLKSAFLDYIDTLKIDIEAKENLRNDIFNYCIGQVKRKEDISLGHISSTIDNEQPELFQEFASGELYRVSANVKGHIQTLKNLKFYTYKSKKLSISFDSGLVNESIFYNEQTNELRITDIPDDLRQQLTNSEIED